MSKSITDVSSGKKEGKSPATKGSMQWFQSKQQQWRASPRSGIVSLSDIGTPTPTSLASSKTTKQFASPASLPSTSFKPPPTPQSNFSLASAPPPKVQAPPSISKPVQAFSPSTTNSMITSTVAAITKTSLFASPMMPATQTSLFGNSTTGTKAALFNSPPAPASMSSTLPMETAATETPQPSQESSNQQIESGNNTTQTSETNNYRERLYQFYQNYNPDKLDSIDSTLASYKGKEEELFRKLEAKYVTGKNGMLPPSGKGPRCFLYFNVEGNSLGRVVVKLFQDKVPLACENFRCLCTGEKGRGRSGKDLCFRGSHVHRVVANFCVQMGDFTKGDGTGGESIYPPGSEHGDMWGKFKDETPFLMHTRKGLLSMANNGPNRNGSQFFITLKATPFLDGKHVVFGEVVEGMQIVEEIGKLQTNNKQRPLKSVLIEDCGELGVDGKETEKESKSEAPKPFGFGPGPSLGGFGPASSGGGDSSSNNQSPFSSFTNPSIGTSKNPFATFSFQSNSAADASGTGYVLGNSNAKPFGFAASNASQEPSKNPFLGSSSDRQNISSFTFSFGDKSSSSIRTSAGSITQSDKPEPTSLPFQKKAVQNQKGDKNATKEEPLMDFLVGSEATRNNKEAITDTKLSISNSVGNENPTFQPPSSATNFFFGKTRSSAGSSQPYLRPGGKSEMKVNSFSFGPTSKEEETLQNSNGSDSKTLLDSSSSSSTNKVDASFSLPKLDRSRTPTMNNEGQSEGLKSASSTALGQIDLSSKLDKLVDDKQQPNFSFGVKLDTSSKPQAVKSPPIRFSFDSTLSVKNASNFVSSEKVKPMKEDNSQVRAETSPGAPTLSFGNLSVPKDSQVTAITSPTNNTMTTLKSSECVASAVKPTSAKSGSDNATTNFSFGSASAQRLVASQSVVPFSFGIPPSSKSPQKPSFLNVPTTASRTLIDSSAPELKNQPASTPRKKGSETSKPTLPSFYFGQETPSKSAKETPSIKAKKSSNVNFSGSKSKVDAKPLQRPSTAVQSSLESQDEENKLGPMALWRNDKLSAKANDNEPVEKALDLKRESFELRTPAPMDDKKENVSFASFSPEFMNPGSKKPTLTVNKRIVLQQKDHPPTDDCKQTLLVIDKAHPSSESQRPVKKNAFRRKTRPKLVADAVADILAERIFSDDNILSSVTVEEVEKVMALPVDSMISVLEQIDEIEIRNGSFSWKDIQLALSSLLDSAIPNVSEMHSCVSAAESSFDEFKSCASATVSLGDDDGDDEDYHSASAEEANDSCGTSPSSPIDSPQQRGTRRTLLEVYVETDSKVDRLTLDERLKQKAKRSSCSPTLKETPLFETGQEEDLELLLQNLETLN